jgi:hypothetical protein
MSRRYFTLDQVQALVPQLAGIVARSVQLQQLLRARAEALTTAGYTVTERLLAGAIQDVTPGDEALLAEARGLYSAIVEEAGRIEQLGGELKGPDLVDFWSWEDGKREVLLCWKLGEREISWFHTPESGFTGRRPVAGHDFTREPKN